MATALLLPPRFFLPQLFSPLTSTWITSLLGSLLLSGAGAGGHKHSHAKTRTRNQDRQKQLKPLKSASTPFQSCSHDDFQRRLLTLSSMRSSHPTRSPLPLLPLLYYHAVQRSVEGRTRSTDVGRQRSLHHSTTRSRTYAIARVRTLSTLLCDETV